MIDDLEEMLKTAVGEVFRKMLKVEVRSVPINSGAMGAETHIASAVGFIGDMTGVAYIYASATFANKLTNAMLEMPESDVQGNEMVNDAMGELANMVVGSVKGAMVERGMSCVLTIPSIVRGSNISIEAISTATRRVLCFQFDDHQRLVVELMIKPPEDNE